jgi:hypothetical protein
MGRGKAAFAEVLALARDIERCGEGEPEWWSPQGLGYDDVAPHPTVGNDLSENLSFLARST